jgi:PAS domain S-box-containing protein
MDNCKTGTSPFLSRLYQEGRRAADIAFADIDDIKAHGSLDPGPFRAAQLQALYGTLPLFVLSHVIVAATFASIASKNLSAPLATWWFTLSYLPVFMLFVLWSRHDRKANGGQPTRGEVRWVEALAIVFGIVWAGCPSISFAEAGGNLRVLIMAITLAASAVGTFAFSRIPAAAILYCCLTTGAAALSGTILGGTIGMTFAIFTVTYGMVLNGLVLNLHREQIQKEIASQERARQSDIITLLLNDFENGTSDWLWECDAKGALTHVSPRFAEITGRSASQLRIMTLAQAVEASPEQKGWAKLHADMADGKPIIAQILEVRLGGQAQYWQLNARPLSTASGQLRGYRGFCRDITAEHEADRKMLEAKEMAEAASAAKSQFLAVMSHELRTPLNAIVGFSEILATRQMDPPNGELTLDYAKTILESSRHLQTLIDDILDATRVENGTINLVEQEFDAAEVIEIAVKMCRDQAEQADVTLVARLIDGIELKADVTRIKQVILNLLANAIKFSPVGGIVNIDVVRGRGDRFILQVRDGGIGVRPEDVARIFEPFVQVEDSMSRRYAGIGLGLAIARRIARLHGGDVDLESRFGSGTTAMLELPAGRVVWPKPQAAQSAGVAA